MCFFDDGSDETINKPRKPARNPMMAIEPGETIVDAIRRHREAFGPGPLLLVADYNMKRPLRKKTKR